MATDLEYALMAGGSYISTRPDKNRFPVPEGWTEFNHKTTGSGFEAVSFQNGNEIVISYAGTYDESILNDIILADIALAAGGWSAQLGDAASYYLDVKAANPNAHITFTGHSLGGGLASIMAVFFNETAVTFDQAPFRNAASVAIAQDLATYLADKFPPDLWLNPLYKFIYGDDTLASREANVSNTVVQGEFLTAQSVADRIGNTLPPLDHGAPDVSGLDLHSQALLTAFLANKNFEDVTFKIPDVIRMIFDSTLYSLPVDQAKENFIERLVRHEFGNAPGVTTADAMLSRFTDDLSKLAQDGGLTMVDIIGSNNVSKTLIAFAMQMYYEDTANAADINKELFSQVAGGIQFDMADVSATFNQAKGSLYFNAYLESQYTAEEQAIIKTMLPNLRNWYVQAGVDGLSAIDQLNNGAFMLGGVRSDNLSGGDAADLLVGNFGDDSLNGGGGHDVLLGGYGNDSLHGDDNAGGDRLEGGTGFDTYYADDGDTLRDSDGQGAIYLNGKQLSFATRNKGETLYKDANGNTYLQIGNTLQINDPLTIENFTSGDLGIGLDEYDPNDPLKKAFGQAEQTKSPIVLDLNGNGIATQDVSNGTFFDYDGNGFAERTGWATSGDGLLVRDLNGNGQIDNGTELFGDRTPLKNGQTAANGFAALTDLDSNGDGKLDSQDSAWTELNIWQDQNSDGITNAGELKTLSDFGIQSIATGYTTNISTDANGNIHQQQGSYGEKWGRSPITQSRYEITLL